MKKLYILTLLLATGICSQAQEFVFSTEQHQDVELTNTNFSSYIRFTTQTPQEIRFRWDLIENTLPESWEAALCDHVSCYIGIPATGTMQFITMAEAQSGVDGFFNLTIVGDDAAEGQGMLTLFVYDALNPAVGDTVSWTISRGNVTGIADFEEDDIFEIYPNPATDVVNIKADGKYEAAIFNAIGQKLISVNGNMNETIDVSALESGVYLITYSDKEGNTASKQFIVR